MSERKNEPQLDEVNDETMDEVSGGLPNGTRVTQYGQGFGLRGSARVSEQRKPSEEAPEVVAEEELEDAAGGGGSGSFAVYQSGAFYSGASVSDF